jgi:hypothetical protein
MICETISPRASSGSANIEDRPEAQIAEEALSDQDRAPVPGIESLDPRIRWQGLLQGFTFEQSGQGRQVRSEKVLPPEGAHEPLLDLAAFPKRFDEAKVLSGCTLILGFDRAQVHGRSLQIVSRP